ncbi:MAG: FadR family transcriptional regulator, partial [Rhodospirillales bacterium]|nr:FadR family transcriptional regulator [Rhodospirillales bacterium]
SWQIGARIVGGDLAQGTRIENENQLGYDYGVSRTVIREAMKRLSAKGLVEVRPRTGTRVLPREHWSLLDPDVMAWSRETKPSLEVMYQLREMRIIVEPGAVALACTRADDEDIERIILAYERMENSVDQWDVYVRRDVDFHLEILYASHNDYLRTLGGIIKTDLLSFITVVNTDVEKALQALRQHKDVALAIADGDVARGQEAMRLLLDVGEARLRGEIEEQKFKREETDMFRTQSMEE